VVKKIATPERSVKEIRFSSTIRRAIGIKITAALFHRVVFYI